MRKWERKERKKERRERKKNRERENRERENRERKFRANIQKDLGLLEVLLVCPSN